MTTAGASAVTVVPASAERWDDVRTVFGTRGDPARCWCQWFRLRGDAWRSTTTAGNRAALRAQLDDASSVGMPPPGLLAYLDDEPVGWTAVGPRSAYPRLLASPTVRAARRDIAERDDVDRVWSVTCFVVRVGFRRQGIAGDLLAAAVRLARDSGATAVEGYPVDTSAKARVSSSELYHGSLGLFVRKGFEEVGRSGQARAVVRLDLAGPRLRT